MKLQNDHSFILTTSYPGIISYLYSREYNILDIKSYYNGVFEDCYLAFTKVDSKEMRKDALHLLEYFGPDNIWVKYPNDKYIRNIYPSGGEQIQSILEYNTDPSLKSFILNGISFSFKDEVDYVFPNTSDIKTGMLVECLTSTGWKEKTVERLNPELQNSYNLLVKYNKIRIKKTPQY